MNPLDPTELMKAAVAEAGLDDFGDRQFVEPLTRQTTALVQDARLSEAGMAGTRLSLIRCLVNRLRLVQDLKDHPEIREEDVRDPIVVIGLPRTGTTKLQRVLSSNPGIQPLNLWRLINPSPFPGWVRGEHDQRIDYAEAYVQALSQRPDFIAAHPMSVHDVDEDIFLMEQSFECLLALVQYRLPSFHAWLKNRPRVPFYTYEKLLLQYLQWQDGGRRGRPWVLKAQTHLGGIRALFEVFPKATVVHCHRDVTTAMASSMRIGEEFRGLVSDHVDLEDLGADILRIYTDEVGKYLQQRKALGSTSTIVDVAYADVVAKATEVVDEIYRARGLNLGDEEKALIAEWEQNNRQHRLGKVEYSIETYGLSRERIERQFADYIAQYGKWMR